MMIDADDIRHILSGQLELLPVLQPTTVKIFVCANSGEFDLERNYLWHEVLPDLQQNCLQHGVDILFIDMLLSNSPENPQTTKDLDDWVREIERCHKDSVGPFFLAFVGDGYGIVPVPECIDKDIFEEILTVAKELKPDSNILAESYELDKNAIPAQYVLKTLNDTHRSSAHHNLLDIIQQSSRKLDSKRDGREEYFVSGLERLIKHALWLSAENCVFVFRTKHQATDFTNGTKSGSPDNLQQVEDDSELSQHPEEMERLQRLKDNITDKVDSANIICVGMPRRSRDSISSNGNNKSMEEYSDNLINAIERKLAQDVDTSIGQYKSFNELPRDFFDYKDSLCHLHHFLDNSKESYKIGFDKYLSKVQAHMINGSRAEHQLCIVKGPDGSGKSSILANSCVRARKLFGTESILIPISVGLTAKTLLAEDVFRTICWQINLVLHHDINIESYSTKKLLNYFHGLMNKISKGHCHLLIFLDGIEKMQLSQNPHSSIQCFDGIDWLTTRLPAKFHIIVTYSSSDNSSAIKRIESKLLTNDVIVNVTNMTEEECSLVLDQKLLHNRRKLTDEQHKTAEELFSTIQNPHLVIYNVNKIAQWPSWLGSTDKPPLNELLVGSHEKLIEEVLTKLEETCGKAVATTVCIYITLARFGLTEVELSDVLTGNDEMLSIAYNDLKPSIFRFPSSILTKALHILKPILCRRFVGLKTLLTWSSKRCSNVVRQRYLSDPEKSHLAHRELANLFLENWNTKDPFDPSKEYDVIVEEIDRLCSPQPLVYNDIMYNTRKLHELWFHLLKSGDMSRFKEHTFCNFEYLLAMADADHMHKVRYNLDLVKSTLVDEDTHVLDLALKAAGSTLRTAPLQLANELIGRMRQIKDYFQRHIEPLVMQCMEWCDNYTLPLLVPLTTWLDNVHVPLVTSMTHDHIINCAALMPNGQHVIVATDTSIAVFHLATRRHVKSFKGHYAEVTCLYLDPVNRALVSGSKDKTVNVWNIDTERLVNTFRDFKTYVTCLTCLSNTQVVCGTDDGSVVVKDMETGEVVKTLLTHRKRVTAAQLCKSNSILITSSLDSRLVLWYTAEWSVMNVIEVDVLTPILSIDVSVDAMFLIAGCDDGSLHVIAMATGTIAQTLKSHDGNIRSVRICKDCHHCVAASSTGDVYLYNFRATEVLDVYKGHKSDVISVMTTENEQLAVSVSKNDVCVWSLLKRYTKETYTDTHSGSVSCLKMTPDSKKVISGGLDGFLKTWNLDISDFADNFIGHTGPITCLDVANDNSFMVSGSSDMTLKVWNLALVSIVTNYKGHDTTVSGVHVLSDNRLVLSLDISQKIHMWKAETGQNMRLYAGPTSLHALAPNSQFCISGAGDSKLQIWKLSDGSVLKEIGHSEKVTCLRCSKDSQYLVTGSYDRSVKVWEIETGKITQIIVEHSTAVRSLCITSDNELTMSSGDDGLILVCSLGLGSVERTLGGHMERVTCLELTADDSVLISGSLDHTVRVWNYRRGTQLTLFDAHYPVIGLVLTDLADRIAIRLADNNHVPILCLHNSPARLKPPARAPVEVTLSVASIRASSMHATCVSNSGSRVDMSVSDFSSEEERALPIKPRPCTRARVPNTISLPPKRRRESSVSSIPQIIQYSPMKAPIQSTVKAQEKRRLKFPLPKVMNKPKNKSENVDSKRSHICCLL